MSEAAKRRYSDPAQRIAMSDATRGIRKTATHRAALSRSAKTRFADPNQRKRQSAIWHASHEKRRATTLRRLGVEYAKQDPARSWTSFQYWLERGYPRDEAEVIISDHGRYAASLVKKHESHWTVSYWMDRGYSRASAVREVTRVQASNAAKSSFSVSRASTSFLDLIEYHCRRKIPREQLLLGKFRVDGCLPGINLVHRISRFILAHAP